MRWFVDISQIGSGGKASRFCVEADQWQKALQIVRERRDDSSPFSNFSIELLDDGYRAIDPGTRTRYVVKRASDDDALTEQPIEVQNAPSIPPGAPSKVESRTGRNRRRGAVAIPDDPVPKAASPQGAAPENAAPQSAAPSNGAAHAAERPAGGSNAVMPAPPTAARPMQAASAFEQMTQGVSFPLAAPTGSSDATTQILPAFKVISERTQPPTDASPILYKELAIGVAEGTSESDAEAIARAEFEVVRAALLSTAQGAGVARPSQFIQLAVFDHEFQGRPKRPPVVTLAFKDWRDKEPVIALYGRVSASIPPIAHAAPPQPSVGQVAETRINPNPVPPEARRSEPSQPPPSQPAPASQRKAPPPTPSSIRRNAASMDDDDTTMIKPDAPADAVTVQPVIHVGTKPAALAAPAEEPESPPPASQPRKPSKPPPPPQAKRPSGVTPAVVAAPVVAVPAASAPAAPAAAVAASAAASVATSVAASVATSAAASVATSVAASVATSVAASVATSVAASVATATVVQVAEKTVPMTAVVVPAAPESVTTVGSPPTLPSEVGDDLDVIEEAPIAARPVSITVEEPPRAVYDASARVVGAPIVSIGGSSNEAEAPAKLPSAPPPSVLARSAPPPAEVAAPSQSPTPSRVEESERMAPTVFEPKPSVVARAADPAPSTTSAPPPAPSAPPAPTPSAPPAPTPSAPPAPTPSTPPAPTPSAPPPSAGPTSYGPGSIPPGTWKPRSRGDDLIAELFEAMCDIEFLADPLDGAEFALRVALDNLPSELALVSFFSLDKREFVVIRAAGTAATPEILESVLMARSPEKTPISHRAMRTNQTIVLDGDATAELERDPRWIASGLALRSVMCAPVQLSGRYIGLIEVANPLDGEPFTHADGNALTYIGQQLAEFLAQRDNTIDEQRVRAPKLAARMRRG